MITYKIIKEHQGSITIQSSLGVGTKVEIFCRPFNVFEKRFFRKVFLLCKYKHFIKCFKKGFYKILRL